MTDRSLKPFEKLSYLQFANLSPIDKTRVEAVGKIVSPSTKLFLNNRVFLPKRNPLIKISFKLYWELITPNPNHYILKKLKIKTDAPLISLPFIVLPMIYRGIDYDSIFKVSYLNILSVMKWINQELEKIREFEKAAYETDTGNKYEGFAKESGLDMYGLYNVLNTLTGERIEREDAVLQMPYESVLLWLARKNASNRMEQMIRDKEKQTTRI